MKPMLKTTVLATSLILALTACSEKKEAHKREGPEKLVVTIPQQNPDEIQVAVDEKTVVDAAELADAAEQLVGPYTFMLADRVFDSALAADPNNKKAQFYKSFLKRFMVFRGIAKRIRPITRAQGNLTELDRQTAEFPNSPLKNFLVDGKEDIKNVSQVIDVIADYKNAINDFRKFTKTNLSLELTLNLNPHIFQQEITRRASESCAVSEIPDKSFRVTCDYQSISQKKINSADMVVLSQMAGGELLMWSFYTAYDLTTLTKLSKDYEYQAKSPQEQLAYLKSLPSIAKLRNDQTLSMIPEIGADISGAIKWAVKYQNDLCRNGQDSAIANRPGFLINRGVCIENISETKNSLVQLDQILRGTINIPTHNDQGEVISNTRMDLMAFLKNPPKDLKQLLPTAVNDENYVTEFGPDKTLGGLLPDGNADKFATKQ